MCLTAPDSKEPLMMLLQIFHYSIYCQDQEAEDHFLIGQTSDVWYQNTKHGKLANQLMR